MSETKPTGEQIRFRSANTGDHVLDTYLESAEIGGRTLTDLLDDLFDPSNSGAFRSDNFEFRFDSNKIQFRVGQFASSTAGFTDVTTFFAIKGTFSTSTAYNNFDVVTTSDKDVYIVHGLSTATTYSSESNFISSANTTKIVDVSEAKDWAIKTDGLVSSTGYSAKAWAIGGTGVDNASSGGAAKDWATKTGGTVNGSDFSAKHYATTGNVATVVGAISNINTLAGINSAISTVSGISGNVTTVANANSNISALNASGVISNIATVSGNISNVNTLANISSNVSTLSAISANVTSVANIASNVTSVAGISSLITSDFATKMNLVTSDFVADMAVVTSDFIADLNSLATTQIIADLDLLATSDFISDLNAVEGIKANVTTVANNITSVNNFADVYRIASSAPTSSLNAGDLYFDTSTNTLKVYGASGWQNAGSSVNGTSERFHYDISGTPTSVTGSDANGNTLAYEAGFIDVYVNGVRMSPQDITISSGDTVTFANALTAGDEVDIVAFGTFSVANMNANNLTSGTVPIARLGSGTKNNTTFLRGDNTFATIDLSTLSPIAGSSSIVTTGALNSGSISSGFGNIDNGTSTLTTGNSDINGTLNVQGETTLQTHLNMGDDDKIKLGASGDLEIYHDTTNGNSVIHDTGSGNLRIRADDFQVTNAAASANLIFANDSNGEVKLYHNGSEKIATTSSGITVTGAVVADSLDISGTVDFDGTTNLDVVDIDGAVDMAAGLTVTGNVSINGGTIKLDGNYPTGTSNVALGDQALDSLSGGGYSVAIGNQALTAMTSGNDNVAVGQIAMTSTTTGSSNVAVGQNCMQANTSGGSNTAVGALALDANTTASQNTAIGYTSLGANTEGAENTAGGYESLASNTTAHTNTGFGYRALKLNTTGAYNAAVGHSALTANTTASHNTAVGFSSLEANTTGTQNTGVGRKSLEANTTGNNNTAVGFNAGMSSTTTLQNTCVGSSALLNATGHNNVAIGYQAGRASTTVSSNVLLGTQAGAANTTGGENCFVGHTSGVANTTGGSNTFLGERAGAANTTAGQNTFIGSYSGALNQTGGGNICIGRESGTAGTPLTSGSSNILIGNGINNGNGSQRLAIGHSVGTGGDNTFTFGKGTGNDRVQNTFTSNASWTRVSDERYKKEITDNTDCGLAFINDLRPVTFKWKAKSELDSSLPDYDASKTTADHTEKMYGLIAQEVKQVLDNHNITDFGGHNLFDDSGIQAISQEMFVHPLIKAVQELSAQVTELQNEVKILRGE